MNEMNNIIKHLCAVNETEQKIIIMQLHYDVNTNKW